MKMKLVSISIERDLKLAISTSTLNTGYKHNLPVGTTTDEIRLVELLDESGVKVSKHTVLPIGQVQEDTASPYSTAAFGLNEDGIDLSRVEEIWMTDLRHFLPYIETPQKEGSIDLKTYRARRQMLLAMAATVFIEDKRDNPRSERAKKFDEFIGSAELSFDGYKYNWLISNAYFSVVQREMIKRGYRKDFRNWPKEYQRMNTDEVDVLVRAHREEMQHYMYTQFVCHEQQLEVARAYMETGIKREVDLAYGIDPTAGADVWALQGVVFDLRYNVGCYMEPNNGYDEQNWGTPQYIPGTRFEAFLRTRYGYLAQYVDAVFIDHLCGFANKYYFPSGEKQVGTIKGEHPIKGFFEIPLYATCVRNRGDMALPEGFERASLPETDTGHYRDDGSYRARALDKMAENVYTILKIILEAGLEVDGETIGDVDRQVAVEETIRRLNYEGNIIPLMYVLLYKDFDGEYDNLQELLLIYELFSSTHNTPHLLQKLCNERREEQLWFGIKYPHQIANFLSQAFGILTTPNQTPLDPSEFTREMGMAILERMAASAVKTVTLTLQDLFALLMPEKYGTSSALTINIPGRDAAVGNVDDMFSVRFPPVQDLLGDRETVEFLRHLSSRPRIAIDYPLRLVQGSFPVQPGSYQNFFTFVSTCSEGRKIIYRNPRTGKWEDYESSKQVKISYDGVDAKPVLEMVIGNTDDHEHWGHVCLPLELYGEIDDDKEYIFVDIAAGEETTYTRRGLELRDGLYIKLAGKTDHHFVIFEKR